MHCDSSWIEPHWRNLFEFEFRWKSALPAAQFCPGLPSGRKFGSAGARCSARRAGSLSPVHGCRRTDKPLENPLELDRRKSRRRHSNLDSHEQSARFAQSLDVSPAPRLYSIAEVVDITAYTHLITALAAVDESTRLKAALAIGSNPEPGLVA